MEIRTHQRIDPQFCGEATFLEPGHSRVFMTTIQRMAVDETGLVHGGFIFGLADYAAMLAVNDPNVVLGSASVKFIKPVRVNETVTADARVSEAKGKKHVVAVQVTREDVPVFEGEFVCFVLEGHVLSPGA
ncbi:MAG: thioesterase [Deltaproteobacteria bacterium]|nr:thioesterase [Deltaproteobacteria bacterium]